MSAATHSKEFERLAEDFLELPHVTHGHGKGGFGENALNVRGKIFAMLTSKHEFAVKLPKDRVAELVASGEGACLEMGSRRMKEWLVVSAEGTSSWKSIAQEAYMFVAGNP